MLSEHQRRIVERAAVAAGYGYRADLSYEDGVVLDNGRIWNPYTNLDHAMALAVALNYKLDFPGNGYVYITDPAGGAIYRRPVSHSDPTNGVCRAVTEKAGRIQSIQLPLL